MPKGRITFNLLDAAKAAGQKPRACWVDRLPQDLRQEVDKTADALANGARAQVNLEAVSRVLVEECQRRNIDIGVKPQAVSKYFRDRVQARRAQ